MCYYLNVQFQGQRVNEEKGQTYIFLRDFGLPQMKSALFWDLNAAQIGSF